MARKKKSQTDKPDAPEGAAEDVAQPSAAAQGAPWSTETKAADTAPVTSTDKADEDAVEDGATSDTTDQDTAGAGLAKDTETDEANTLSANDTGSKGDTAPAEDAPAQDDTQQTTPVEADTFSPDETEKATSDKADATSEDEPHAPAEGDTASPHADQAEEAAPMVRTEQVTVRQGGFWSMLIGGIAAAAIGVAAAPYIYPYLPTGQPPVPAPADNGDEALTTRLDEQAQRISDLGARIDGLPEQIEPSDGIDGLSETVTSLTERVADLEVRLSNLEVRPAPEAPEMPDTAATDAALGELRESLAAQNAEIEDLRATLQAEEQAARESARATLQRAALTRVMTALDTGEEFTTAVSDLRETGASVPDVLTGAAENGVPTRAQLVESFPGAARMALAAARTSGGDSDVSASVGGFLRAQLGVRSLEPREGDDPDAVLSRAEAALAEGRLGDALAEIETLPETARSAMSGWAADAEARRDALSAAEALSTELN